MKLASSFFASSEVQSREVTLPDGSKHTLHFKELPVVEFRKFHMAESSDDEETRATSIAKLISASLVDSDGKPAITLKDAARLNSAAANAIVSAILDVNGFGSKNG
jgi:hypothetical protein